MLIWLALAARATGAPLTDLMANQLDHAREAYRAELKFPLGTDDWEARYHPPTTDTPALHSYDRLLSEATHESSKADPRDPFFQRKALWVRPYAADGTQFRVLEVFDRAQAMGVTDLYLETFCGGQVIYGGGSNMAFPPRYPGLNVAKYYAREARRRGIRLYAWVHTLRWGQDYANGHGQDLVYDGWGQPPTAAEGFAGWFVSPSSPSVRDRLNTLVDEIAAVRYFDGIYLDYIRYPSRVKGETSASNQSSEPRNYWGYNTYALQAFFRDNPTLDTQAFRAFLFKGHVEDEAQRERWLRVWIDWQAHEIETLIAGIRERTHGKLKLGLAFFPSYYFSKFDSRAQDSMRWLGHADEVNALCYSYFPEWYPDPHGAGQHNIDRELAILEAGIAALPQGTQPNVMASLTQDPPGTPTNARHHHWPFRTQLSYLKGRRLEGAYPHLRGVSLFSYGWLFPDSEKARRDDSYSTKSKQNT